MPGSVSVFRSRPGTEASLPLSEIYFPLGFAVEVRTNSREVLDIAQRAWGTIEQQYDAEPLVISLDMVDGQVQPQAGAPLCHVRQGFLEIIFDGANNVVADLSFGVAWGQLSRSFLQDSEGFCYHVLEAAALSMISTTRAIALHAACVEWNGHGVMLCGESGAGKTSLAYACALAGWRYLSDDATYLLLGRSFPTVTGNCRKIRFREAAVGLFPELGGRMTIRRAAGKPSIEVDAGELSNIRCTTSTRIRHIIFLNRDSDKPQALRSFDAQRALDYFTKFLLPGYGDYSARKDLENLIKVGVHELRYQELGWAVNRMRRLVESGE